MNDIHNETIKHSKIRGADWIALILLGLSGQLAWAIEDSWFNTFVFDTISPDPGVISWMVGASAITATLTTLMMGTLSDRVGKRRAFILFGFIFWGLCTVLFPITSYIKTLNVTIVAVILADVIMTFFGATAYDAAFNAWVTDISCEKNRGRIQGALEALPFIAMMLSLVVSGIIIDNLGYFAFFFILGGIVIINGIVGGLLLKESPNLKPQLSNTNVGFWKQLIEIFRWQTVKQNKYLFMVFGALCISGIAMQIYMPYQMIYLTNYLGYEYTEIGLVIGASLLLAVIFSIPFGRLVDRYPRKKLAKIGPFISFVGSVAVSLAKSLPALFISSSLLLIGMVTCNVVLNAWIRDLTPEKQAGQFQGLRMIFFVAIPMVIGPLIGSTLIQTFGIPTVLNGANGFIPTPIIYRVSAIIALLPLIPITLIDIKQKNKRVR